MKVNNKKQNKMYKDNLFSMAKIKFITTSSESIGRKESSNDMPVSNCIQKVC